VTSYTTPHPVTLSTLSNGMRVLCLTKWIKEYALIEWLTRVETMATDEKISKGLKSAATYLEHSVRALDKKDGNSLMDSVWHLAAELEYALFMFSMALEDEKDKPKWRSNPRLKKIGVGSMLVVVQDLLKEVDKHMKEENLLEAYKKTDVARRYVLKVQRDFARKKREALKVKEAKKKTTPPRKPSSP